jgi:RNA polymerase sigma factor (sigma-70 family)
MPVILTAGSPVDSSPQPALSQGFVREAAELDRTSAPRSVKRDPLQAEGTKGGVFLRDLTAAIRHGDEAAFGRFYDLYGFRLYKFVLVLARGQETEAREVTQAVLIKLARGLPDFDDEAKLWSWLCKVAKNVFLDHCRSRRRQPCHTPLEQLVGEVSDESGAQRQLAEHLEEALAVLTPEERELIQAVYVDCRRLGELAAEGRQTYKAMESKLARLRERLKKHLLTQFRHEQ